MPISSINGEPIEVNDGSISTQKIADKSVTINKFDDTIVDVTSSAPTSFSGLTSIDHGFVDSPSDGYLAFADENGYIDTPTRALAKSDVMDVSAARGLVIADESGNVALDAVDGLVNTLFGKTFSIVGDSISTFDGYIPEGYQSHYPRSDVNNVGNTWWEMLRRATGMRLLTNASWTGSRVSGNSLSTTGEVGCSDARVSALVGQDGQTPDIIIVFMGTNDFGHNVTLGQADHTVRPSDGTMSVFSEAYLLLLYKLHETYPLAHVYCSTLLPRKPSAEEVENKVNGNGDTTDSYNREIRRLAAAMNCGLIDFSSCGFSAWNGSTYYWDGFLHPKKSGMSIMSRFARKAIENSYSA